LGVTNGEVKITNKYLSTASEDDQDTFSELGGSKLLVDTPLEFALLSYYSQPVATIRPAEAARELPAASRTSEVKLAAAVYKELQEIKFLDPNNKARIGRYEGMLKFIQDGASSNKPITQNDINAALRASISDTVDEEFGKISFMIDNGVNGSYDAILTRTPTNQYILDYERPSIQNDDKKLSSSSLEALLAAMKKSGDFVPTALDTVRAQAALIPAVHISVSDLNAIKQTIVSFYNNPQANNFNAIINLYKKYMFFADDLNRPEIVARGKVIANSIEYTLNTELSKRL
jgi:hypothetical protein